MARPALPNWATDGGATLEPSAGEKAAGFSASQKPPARWFNWWMNLLYQWCVWLTTGMDDEDFAWTGSHEFNGATKTFKIGTQGGILTVAAGGDSVSVNAHYSDLVPGSHWQAVIFPGSDTSGIFCDGTAGTPMYIELAKNVPSNAKLESVVVQVLPYSAVATAANRMEFRLFSRDTGTFVAVKTTAQIALVGADTLNDSGSAVKQNITLTLDTPLDVDRSDPTGANGGFRALYLYVRSATTGGSQDSVFNVTQNFKIKSYNPY